MLTNLLNQYHTRLRRNDKAWRKTIEANYIAKNEDALHFSVPSLDMAWKAMLYYELNGGTPLELDMDLFNEAFTTPEEIDKVLTQHSLCELVLWQNTIYRPNEAVLNAIGQWITEEKKELDITRSKLVGVELTEEEKKWKPAVDMKSDRRFHYDRAQLIPHMRQAHVSLKHGVGESPGIKSIQSNERERSHEHKETESKTPSTPEPSRPTIGAHISAHRDSNNPNAIDPLDVALPPVIPLTDSDLFDSEPVVSART